MTVLDFAGDGATLVREQESAILLVFHETAARQLLHHAGDGRLPDFERRRDVHHAGVAFALDQLVNALEIIFGALAGRHRGWHGESINHKIRNAGKRGACQNKFLCKESKL